MGPQWNSREKKILSTNIAKYGVDKGAEETSKVLPRTKSACIGQFYYKTKESISVKSKFEGFEKRNNDVYAIFKVIL